MLFDILLIIMIVITLSKASAKGCTDDLSFSLAFLIIVRIAGGIYIPLSGFLSKFIESRNLSLFASYIVSVFIVYFIYNSIVGIKVIEFGKKIPKTTGRAVTYIFAVFKVLIIYSVIFSFAYAFPVLHRMPDRYITPKTQRITNGVLGKKTNDLFVTFKSYLATLNNPMEFLEKQKRMQETGAERKRDAVKEHEGLEDFVRPEKTGD